MAADREDENRRLEAPFWKQTAVGTLSGLIVFGLLSAGGGVFSLVNELTFDEWVKFVLLPASALGTVVSFAFWALSVGKLDRMLYERLTSVYVQLTLTQRLLVREHLRDVIKTAEALGWHVEDDFTAEAKPFTAVASLTFKSPDGKEVKVSPVEEDHPSQAEVAAKLIGVSPANFPDDWRAAGD